MSCESKSRILSSGEGAFRPAAGASAVKPAERGAASPGIKPSTLGGEGCKELASVQCRLETKDLWDKFHDLGTEMIITKSGR